MAARRKNASSAAAVIGHLRELGLGRYPGAHVKSPWPGHLDLAVADKTFAYLSAPGDPPGLSLKLPFTGSIARSLPGATPTGYGLGKSGWVSLSFDGHPLPPIAQLEAWLDESYRAQAPKRLLAAFEARVGGSAPQDGSSKTRAQRGRTKPKPKSKSKEIERRS
jgi:predicted DNA-binding protein (MmcQ/YjbR family)